MKMSKIFHYSNVVIVVMYKIDIIQHLLYLLTAQICILNSRVNSKNHSNTSFCDIMHQCGIQSLDGDLYAHVMCFSTGFPTARLSGSSPNFCPLFNYLSKQIFSSVVNPFVVNISSLLNSRQVTAL